MFKLVLLVVICISSRHFGSHAVLSVSGEFLCVIDGLDDWLAGLVKDLNDSTFVAAVVRTKGGDSVVESHLDTMT